MNEKAEKALRLEALRRVVNDESWEARCRLETSMIADTPDENAWCDKAMHTQDGDVTPEFTRGGFKVVDRRAFEEWCVANGFGRLEWVIDEQKVMEGCDSAGGLAYFDGEEVPGLAVLVEIPNGVSLHPSKTCLQSIREAVRRDYL